VHLSILEYIPLLVLTFIGCPQWILLESLESARASVPVSTIVCREKISVESRTQTLPSFRMILLTMDREKIVSLQVVVVLDTELSFHQWALTMLGPVASMISRGILSTILSKRRTKESGTNW
jgi:hypothetical protein